MKWSFERNADPGLASPIFEAYLSDIVGLSERVRGDADDIEGVQVIDDYTIEIRLKQPTPYFLGKLIFLTSAALDKDYVPRGREMTDVRQMVGTGPFKIVQHERKQMDVLEAFQDYHGGAPKLKRIERMVIKDAMTRLNKYKKGDLDMVMLARQDLDGLKGTEFESHLRIFPRPAIWYIGLNQEKFEPFRDKRVRQAFAMVIDKERIVNEILGGHNVIANSIVPPFVPGHRPDAPALPFDPIRAKQLFAKAGYPEGKGFPEMILTFREDRPDIKLAAITVAENLKTHLGIIVTLQTMEWRAYIIKFNNHDQVFFHMRWAADYLDPQNFLSHMLATFGPENKIGYNNPEFDRLCKLADSMMEMEKRIPLYQEAEDILLDDAVWIPLYFQSDAELHRPGLSGLRESVFGHLPHTTTEMKR
ncbi:MAG: peptide ABC transporter substrate-binding protein [Armatimonadetes bacterium]|nr:peptide ABC transporter substrate-binding protein [Armatimonadota bacterium]